MAIESVPLSDAEFLAQCDSYLRRLSHDIDLLETGDLSGADSVSAILRTLISPGNGNDLIRRMIDRFDLTEPRVVISGPPEQTEGTVVFLANFPLDPDNPSSVEASTDMDFWEWLELPTLVVPSVRKTGFTWPEVVRNIANTIGSHADPVVKPFLLESNVLEIGGMTLLNFAIWEAAWQVERCLTDLLSEAGAFKSGRIRSFQSLGLAFDHVGIHRTKDPRADESIEVPLRVTLFDPPLEILTYDFHGTTRIYATANPDLIHIVGPRVLFGNPPAEPGDSFFKHRL